MKPLIILVVMALSLVPGILMLIKTRKIKKHFRTAEARVLNVENEYITLKNDDGTKYDSLSHYKMTLEYMADGCLQTKVKNWNPSLGKQKDVPQESSVTKIYYNPENPSDIYFTNYFLTPLMAFVLGIFAGLIIVSLVNHYM